MKKSNQGQKYKCKTLYFEYKSLDDIVIETSVNRNTLNSWVYGRTLNDPEGWKYQRDVKRDEALQEQHAIKLLKIEKILCMSADFIAYSLQERITRKGSNGKPIAFSTKEALATSQIALNMKKLVNLEEGLPTENINVNINSTGAPSRSLEVLEIRNILKKDPVLMSLLPKEEGTNEPNAIILNASDADRKWNELLDSPGIQATPNNFKGAELASGSESDGDRFDQSFEGSNFED